MAQEIVLVTGGSGFIGHHIIKALRLQKPSWTLHSLSRNPNRNGVDGAHYHAGSISSYEQVRGVFQHVQPTVVIHTASPPVVGDKADQRSYHRTNVAGTRCVLDCALAARSVKAFVYTSSTLAVEGDEHVMSTEDHPVRTRTSKCDDYPKTKALAETMVLEANGTAGMPTASLRLPSSYGTRDEQNIAGAIKMLRRNEHKVQVGNNTNLCDWLSAGNAAQAHLLAVDALLAEKQHPPVGGDKVAGEAFTITDGDPLPFWEHFRVIWRAAGDRTPEGDVTKIPVWVAMCAAAVIELLYWVFTLGTRKPKRMRRDLLGFTRYERTFSIEKARRRLDYVPAQDRDAQVRDGVAWYLDLHPT